MAVPTQTEFNEKTQQYRQWEEGVGSGKVTTGIFADEADQIKTLLAGISGGGGGPGGCQCTTELTAIETAVTTADTNIVAANAATTAAVNSANTAIVAANAAVEASVDLVELAVDLTTAAVTTADTNIVAANAATEAAVNAASVAIVASVDAVELAVDLTTAAVNAASTAIVAANAATEASVDAVELAVDATTAAVADVETAVNNAAAKTSIQAADSPSMDAFGRWRVSSPLTLFDGRSGYSENLIWSNQLISGTMTSSQSNPTAQTLFTSTANTAGRRIRQSLKRFVYTPGKSQLILTTFNFNTLVSGNTKKVGYFDDDNGIFIQANGTEISVNKRSSTGGTPSDTKVTQANWNLDKLDGTGASGITMDFTKTQIFIVDLEWLGVGRVRVGFVVDGIIHYCHEFNHANIETVVYMSTGNLPIRYEMEHSGTGGSSSLSCICATVMSEGGSEPIGSPGARFTGTVSGLQNGVGHCLFALRLRAAQTHSPVVRITGLDVMGTTNNDAFAWYILRNPTLSAGSFSFSGLPETSIELALGSSTVRTTNFGSTIILGGLGYSRVAEHIETGDDVQLETEADGTPIPLVFVVFPYNNMTGAMSVRWRQFG